MSIIKQATEILENAKQADLVAHIVGTYSVDYIELVCKAIEAQHKAYRYMERCKDTAFVRHMCKNS